MMLCAPVILKMYQRLAAAQKKTWAQSSSSRKLHQRASASEHDIVTFCLLTLGKIEIY